MSARITVLANPAYGAYGTWMHSLTVAAQELGLQLHVLELHSADELDSAFAAMTQASADALIVLSDPARMSSLRGRMADLAAKSRLPAMCDWREYVAAAGLRRGAAHSAGYRGCSRQRHNTWARLSGRNRVAQEELARIILHKYYENSMKLLRHFHVPTPCWVYSFLHHHADSSEGAKPRTLVKPEG